MPNEKDKLEETSPSEIVPLYSPNIAPLPELKRDLEAALGEDKGPLTKREEAINTGKTSLCDDDRTTFPYPDSGCRQPKGGCGGRGYVGWSAKDGLTEMCPCIIKRVGKVDPSLCMTYGEFKTLMNIPKPPYPRDHTRPKSLRRQQNGRKR